jgi:hemerythrin
VPEIDEEHKELVARMNRLAGRIKSGDLSGIDEILVFLEGYVRFHFDNEERMMRTVSYPLINEHLQEHRTFSQQYVNLKRDIASGLHDPLYLGFRIQLFLFDWWAAHMTKTDRHLGKFIRAQRGERRGILATAGA